MMTNRWEFKKVVCKVVKACDFGWLTLETGLGLLEACDHMRIYNRRNPGHYFVINEENGDVEDEVVA